MPLRKPEQVLWDDLKKATACPAVIWQRHEDRYSTDIADLSFSIVPGASGWVELKVVYDLEVTRDGQLRLRHMTMGQAQWLVERWERGTLTFVLLQYEDTYWLIPGKRSFALVEGIRLERLNTFRCTLTDVPLKVREWHRSEMVEYVR